MSDGQTIPNDGQAAAPQGGEGQTAPAGTSAESGAAASASGDAQAAAATSPAAAEGDSGLIRPEGLADEFWDPASGVKVSDLVAAYRDLSAKEAERTKDVPAEAAGYALELPETVKVPENFKIELAEDDPFLAEARAAAHAAGLPTGAWKGLVAAYANMQIREQEAAVQAYTAEKAKLGERADVRLKSVTEWLGANLKADQAKALIGSLYNADQIRAVEAIIALRSEAAPGQGGGQAPTKFEGKFGESRLDAIRAA